MTREYAKWVSKATYDTHPDWSGAWAMVGGTVFDRATQTSEGGATSKGVRSHPPYNAEWEAIQLIVEDEKGAKVEWSLEWGAPNQLGRQGIRPSTFPAGAKVIMRLRPMLNGAPAGAFVGAKFPDGKTVGRWE